MRKKKQRPSEESTSTIFYYNYTICNEMENSAVHNKMGDLENVSMLSESQSEWF